MTSWLPKSTYRERILLFLKQVYIRQSSCKWIYTHSSVLYLYNYRYINNFFFVCFLILLFAFKLSYINDFFFDKYYLRVKRSYKLTNEYCGFNLTITLMSLLLQPKQTTAGLEFFINFFRYKCKQKRLLCAFMGYGLLRL